LRGVNAPSVDELVLWEEHYLKALTETGQWGVVSKFGVAYVFFYLPLHLTRIMLTI
jgi:hypothetical protein